MILFVGYVSFRLLVPFSKHVFRFIVVYVSRFIARRKQYLILKNCSIWKIIIIFRSRWLTLINIADNLIKITVFLTFIGRNFVS